MTLNINPNANLTPKRTLESVEIRKKNKRDVAKVRVEPKSNGIPDVKHNRYANSSTPSWAIADTT